MVTFYRKEVRFGIAHYRGTSFKGGIQPDMITGLERIANKARNEPSTQFNNIVHHITGELLEKCVRSIPLNSASGVDRMTVDSARSGFLEWYQGLYY